MADASSFYQVSDGLEQWMGYARRSGGRLDRLAIDLVEDKHVVTPWVQTKRYTDIGSPVRESDYRPRQGYEAREYREAKRRSRARRAS